MSAYIYNMGLRFKDMASAYPDRPALAFADRDISYHALDEHSDRIAAHLQQRGVRQGDVVAILAEKQPMTYACLLAALKLGAPYVALDTANPASRLDKILERAQPHLIIRDSDFADLEQPVAPITPEVIRAVSGSVPAYLMFTSGSTGFPKGVAVSHASMLNFCHWARETFAVTPQDRLTGVNPLYFDNSIFDLSASLFNGACLKPVTSDVLRQAKRLVEMVADCSLWFSVPSLLIYLSAMKAFDRRSWPRMRAVIFGGEGFAKTELKKLHAMYSDQATLWNVYGPTECTCICSAHAIDERDFHDMGTLAPLGHLAPNIGGAVMSLDGARGLPDGETGELYLFGPQIALGYYRDPERTRAAFAPSPLSPHAAMPCYRTGDLVRRDPATGYYHFAGRRDHQIKHMGYRIELEEIEAALHGFDEIVQAAVIYAASPPPTAGRIVAVVQLRTPLEEAAIIRGLREALPPYMIPASVHVVDELPKNANGKVDRRALTDNYVKAHA